MRHRIKGKKLGRDTGHRKALQRNLARSLIMHGRIKTTRAKADFVRPFIERQITVAKRGLARAEESGEDAAAVHARRIVGSRLYNDRVLVGMVFDKLAPLYKEREGGYTRIYRLGPRKGDNADMVILELVDYDEMDADD